MSFGEIDLKITKHHERKKRKQEQDSSSKSNEVMNIPKRTENKNMQKSEPNLPHFHDFGNLINVGSVLNANSVSHRVGASICNAFLKDMNFRNECYIVDPSKVYRAKETSRKLAVKYHESNQKSYIDQNNVFALFFDGRKDDTFTIRKNSETKKLHPRIEKQNHYTILFQPHDLFYTHVTPKGPRSIDTAKCVFEKLVSDDINTDKLHIPYSYSGLFLCAMCYILRSNM